MNKVKIAKLMSPTFDEDALAYGFGGFEYRKELPAVVW